MTINSPIDWPEVMWQSTRLSCDFWCHYSTNDHRWCSQSRHHDNLCDKFTII